MDCPEENVIVDFARGELGKAERATVEAHIDECGACSQLVAEMARIFADEPDDPASRPPQLPISRPSQATLATDGAFSPSSATIGGGDKPPEQILPQGAKLGRYVVIDRVGAGGMGVVYAAYDPELDRKVALKVLRSSPKKHARNDQSARLIREAQAMAKLSHPNVITVHDVGTFEEQVFIAMEFIDGGTLGQWLAKERRTWRDVLKVFRAAGEGLEAAHEGGLVHRDFKPDNVLMGNDGRVLVTDFGLARPAAGNTGRFGSVSASPSGQGMLQASLTQTGALVGTPAYMAPEQLHGRSTNALTDQFSFCVTLYEALYGERPFEGQALVELVHNVSEGNVRAAPRDASVPRWLRRAVIHGLETKAKDRYPSMRALLDALRRDPWRQWRRWGTFTIPTAVLGIGIMAYQQVERAEESYCDRVPEMLAGVWDDGRQSEIKRAFLATSRPYANEVYESMKATLDGYSIRWTAMQTEVCRDELRAEQPQAVLALRMGCLSRRLGSLETITDLLTTADADTVAAAVDAARSLPSLETCTDLEALTERIEMVRTPEAREAAEEIDRLSVQAKVLIAAAKSADAIALAETMIERSREATYRRGEAEGLYILGQSLLYLNKRDEAETSFHRALSASLAAGHSDVMAQASVGLVWIAADEGRPLDESERWAAHGLAALEQISAPRPATKSELYHALGVARHRAGKFDGADEAFNLGLAALEGAAPRQDRASAALLAAKAGVLFSRGQLDEALATYEAASEVVGKEYGDRHPNVATLLDNRGSILSRLGRLEEAIAMQQAALEIRSDALGAQHVMVGGSHQNISITLTTMGEYDGAQRHAEKAVEVMVAALGDRSLELVGAKKQLAYVLGKRRKFDDAVAVLEAALNQATEIGGPEHPRSVAVRAHLGWALFEAGDDERAEALLQLALAQLTVVHGEQSTKVAQNSRRLAEVQLSLGKVDEAAKLADTALEAAKTNAAEEEMAHARFALARALTRLPDGDRSRAIRLADQAREYFASIDDDRSIRIATWIAEHV